MTPSDVEQQLRELTDRANTSFNEGNYHGGVDLAAKAYELASAMLDDRDPWIADCLHNLAVLEKRAGNLADAEAHARRALVLLKGSHDRELALSHVLNALVEISARSRDYDAAVQYASEALNIRRRLLGECHLLVAESLNNLAATYELIGERRLALLSARQALDLRRELSGGRSREFVESVMNVALQHAAIGDHTEAAKLFQEAFDIARGVLGDSHPHVGHILELMGREHARIGDWVTALKLFAHAMKVFREALPPVHPMIADLLDEIGWLRLKRGDYAEAHQSLLEALSIREQAFGPEHPVVIASWLHLGEMRLVINDLQGAMNAWWSVTVAPLATDDESRVARQGIAMVWLHAGEYQKAVDLLRSVIDSIADDNPARIGPMNDLGINLMRLGQFAEAETCFTWTLESARSQEPVYHDNEALALTNLGQMHLFLGTHDRAEYFLREALEVGRARYGESHPCIAGTLSDLAVNAAALRQYDRAIELLEEKGGIDDRVIGMVFASSSERQRLEYLAQARGTQHLLLSSVLSKGLDDAAAVRAGFDLVLRRKALTLDAYAALRRASDSAPPHLAAAIDQLQNLNGQIAQATLDGPGSGNVDEHRLLLAEWAERKARLESDVAGNVPAMDISSVLLGVDTSRVADALPDSAVLVEFVRVRPSDFGRQSLRAGVLHAPWRYIVFVLAAGRPESLAAFDLGEAKGVDAKLRSFRDDVERRAQTASGDELRAAVLDPVLEVISDSRRVFIAPDGNLAMLPFEILPLADGRLVIDEYEISYLGTGRDLLQSGSRASTTQSPPLVIAAPDFNLSNTAASTAPGVDEAGHRQQSADLRGSQVQFGPLAGTRREGERIGALLGVAPVLGEAATEGRIRATQSPRVLHLATHGFFLPDQPDGPRNALNTSAATFNDTIRYLGAAAENPLLRCGLALAGANTRLAGGSLPADAGDGILNGDDVSRLDLSNTDLVVLSACETGLGVVAEGEGVLGLRRGFLIAGARSMIMSMWKVPDAATAELMEAFYAGLVRDMPPARALREAQQTVRRHRPDAFFWGAFVCQGDTMRDR